MSAYTRKPVTATAHCPICPWIKTYFQNDNPKLEVKNAAALGQVAHILSEHPAAEKVQAMKPANFPAIRVIPKPAKKTVYVFTSATGRNGYRHRPEGKARERGPS